MTSWTDVTNEALQNIGSQAFISSLTEDSTEAQAANVLFDPTLRMLLRTAHWNFARKQIIMSLISAAQGTPENPPGTPPVPPLPWLYEYAYPSDCLQARYVPALVQPTTTSPPLTTAPNQSFTPLPQNPSYGVKFLIASDTNALTGTPQTVVLTNMPKAQLVYTAYIANPDLWDSTFREAMMYSLSAKLINAIARNKALFDEMAALAQNVVNQARVSDGNEGVTSQDHLPDWMAVRGATGFIGYPGYTWMGWSNFSLGGGF